MEPLSNPIPVIQNAKHSGELLFCEHALQRMLEREISVDQIEQALDCSGVEEKELFP